MGWRKKQAATWTQLQLLTRPEFWFTFWAPQVSTTKEPCQMAGESQRNRAVQLSTASLTACIMQRPLHTDYAPYLAKKLCHPNFVIRPLSLASLGSPPDCDLPNPRLFWFIFRHSPLSAFRFLRFTFRWILPVHRSAIDAHKLLVWFKLVSGSAWWSSSKLNFKLFRR